MQVKDGQIVVVATGGMVELRTQLGRTGVWKSMFLKEWQADELVGALLTAIKQVK